MSIIVVGALNTDFVASGMDHFPGPGEYAIGTGLSIAAGGKSRNIADMTARLSSAKVSIISRTVRDPYGLWRLPMDALAEAGVDTAYVNVLAYEDVKKLPGMAFIPVDTHGNNQIFVVPGASDDFSPDDIDRAKPLFQDAAQTGGMLIVTLEIPPKTAARALATARDHGLKTVLEPGGVAEDSDVDGLFEGGLFLIKPNEHEVKILTSVEVTDITSAEQAADSLRHRGVEWVFITVGAKGAYLFGPSVRMHIPVPEVLSSGVTDETGCGDQTLAALCASLSRGDSPEYAAQRAVLAGALQFHKAGVQPISRIELSDASALRFQ